MTRPFTGLQRPLASFVPERVAADPGASEGADDAGGGPTDGAGVLAEDLTPEPSGAGGQARHVAEAGAGEGEVAARRRIGAGRVEQRPGHQLGDVAQVGHDTIVHLR
jgi:hypothetical protein